MVTAVAALANGVVQYPQKKIAQMVWNATVSGRGNPFHGARFPDKQIQLQGPTGGTSRIIMEGTNGLTVSTATWIPLRSVTDGAIDSTNVTGGLFFQMRGNPYMIRPHFETVTAAKTLSVIIIAK